MSPATIAIIPTRLGSTRFPGKALAAETGMPLILHVAQAVSASDRIDRIIVASENPEIEAVCREAGVEHAMTAPTHENGSSRIAEVASGLDASVILNIQGDEPEIEAEVMDATLEALDRDPEAGVATAATPWPPDCDPSDPNIVKVVCDQQGRALYFSRAAIPHECGPHMRHVGIYAYRPQVLQDYARMQATPLEQAERLEQLRLLEHGIPMTVAKVPTAHPGIDTPSQYADFVHRFQSKLSD